MVNARMDSSVVPEFAKTRWTIPTSVKETGHRSLNVMLNVALEFEHELFLSREIEKHQKAFLVCELMERRRSGNALVVLVAMSVRM
jgi:hypothetical protein